MAGEWLNTTLGKVAKFDSGYRNSQDAIESGEFPFFTCSREILRHSEFDFDSEAVIMAGNNADARFHLQYYKGKFAARQRTYIITPASDDVICRYLYYALHKLQPLFVAQAQGTTTKFVTIGILRNAPISLPPVSEQRVIVRILGSLDDKIDLNRRMNETLEAIARAIFKSWFVDFDPVRAKASGESPESICRRLSLTPELLAFFPDRLGDSELGEIPEEWGIRPVGEIVQIVGGSTPSTKNSDYWQNGTVHWATPKDLSGLAEPILLNTERKITELGLKQISSGLLPAGTLLMSSRAPVGYLAISEVPIAVNQGFIAILCDAIFSPYYMLNWCRFNMDTIKQRASGTTFAEISKSSFRPIPALVPSVALLQQFSFLVEPLYALIAQRCRENTSLGNIRDSLLRRLLSGELRVPAEVD